MKSPDISRRSFLAIGSAAMAGGALAMAGCSPAQPAADDAEAAVQAPSFFTAPEPITEFVETKDFDVVVVGAGASGVAAALSAKEAGASVACLQKESTPISQGSYASGIVLEESDPSAIAAMMTQLMKDSGYRSDRKLLDVYAQNSGEAVKWASDHCLAGGAITTDPTFAMANTTKSFYGKPISYFTIAFPQPTTFSEGVKCFASQAEEAGVEFFFSTPGRQLIVEDGRVVAVVGETEDGYVRFNAKKGVILAAGDYQNDEEMCNYYVPDLNVFVRKQNNRTGDGIKMGLWVGGHMEPMPHTKAMHDFDAGPAAMMDMPFLCVNGEGNRFTDESVPMALMNNMLRKTSLDDPDNIGRYSQIFDSNYMTQTAEWPGHALPPEAFTNYMPEEPGEKTGVATSLIAMYKADTLEELAEKIQVDPETFTKTVARYNELAAKGADDDFGKNPLYLNTVDTPPFYACRRWLRVTAIHAGLEVNERSQVLREDGSAIDGLYAIGNMAGGFYSGIDYPMSLSGLSLGRCFTFGYVVGREVAQA